MPYDVGDALSRIEQILLNSMQRNLHRHLHEEQDEGMQWTMWQTEQLTALRTWSARNLKSHTPAFTKINDAAIRLLEDSGKQAELAEERQLLEDGIQQAGAFFHALEDKVQALLTSVRHDLSRAEYSILRQADDVYRKAIFDAQVYLQTGSGTLENAIDMAVQDLQKNGIQSVVYRNGRRVEASTYARMALRSANVRARLAGEGKARDRYGIHTVIAPPSGIACEKCVKWLCRVLVDDVYCSGTAAEADALGVPLLSQAIAQGFLHPQCNCSLHTYHTGSPVVEMSQEERDEAVRKYRLTQKQRYNERQIRKWKRAEKSAPDETARKAAAARRREWQNVNRQLCDEHHDFLRRDYSREKIYDAPERVIVPDCIEKSQSSEPVPPTLVQPAPSVPEKIQPTEVAISAPDKWHTDEWISPKTVEMKLTDGAQSGIMNDNKTRIHLDTELYHGEVVHYDITDERIRHISDIEILQLSMEQNQKLTQGCRNLLEHMKDDKLGREGALVFNMDMAEIDRYKAPGATSSISLKSYPQDCIVIHNHPSDTLLSDSDLLNFYMHDEVKILGAVGHNGSAYFVEKTDNYDAFGFWDYLEECKLNFPVIMSPTHKVKYIEKIMKGADEYGIRFYTKIYQESN